MTGVLWTYVPSLPPWRGVPHSHCPGPAASQAAPRGGLAAQPGLAAPPEPRASSTSRRSFSRPPSCQLGLPASSLLWTKHGQVFGDKPTQRPVGNLGVEQASRNERPAGREGCQGGSLIRGLSVLVSHGAWARTSLRPFTLHRGPDPRGLLLPRAPQGDSTQWGMRMWERGAEGGERSSGRQEQWRAHKGRVDNSRAALPTQDARPPGFGCESPGHLLQRAINTQLRPTHPCWEDAEFLGG